jgi:hypothetical protein
MLTENRYYFPYFYAADRWTQREENETGTGSGTGNGRAHTSQTHEGVKNMFIYRRANPALET